MTIKLLLPMVFAVMMGCISNSFAASQTGVVRPVAVKAGVCEAEILGAAQKWGVPAGILHSVGLTETGRKGTLYPYALNIEGRTVYAASRQDALMEFDRARAQGHKLIDLGCMQINYRYHSSAFSSVDQMLDPRANVNYAARFLAELHKKHETWTMAVARYHAGPNNDPAQKKYICRVIRNLVITGHGAWTKEARVFCQ